MASACAHEADLVKVFQKAQKSAASHPSGRALLERIAAEALASSDATAFLKCLLYALQPALVIFKREKPVERLLGFVAQWVASSKATVKGRPLYVWLLKRLLAWHGVKDKAVRLRVTQLIANILNEFIEDECDLNDSLWELLVDALCTRAQDKTWQVRVEAVRALTRLQQDDDPNDEVTALIIQIVAQDPIKEVRQAALLGLSPSKYTLAAITERVIDIEPSVRVRALEKIGRQLNLKNLKVKQRVDMFGACLRDKDANVRAAAVALAKQWLNNDIIALVAALHVDQGEATNIDAAEALVNALLEDETSFPLSASEALAAVEANPSTASVLVWRVLCNHLRAKEDFAGLDSALPDVPTFVRLLTAVRGNERADAESATTELLKVAVWMDVSDARAREIMRGVAGELLAGTGCPEKNAPHLLALLNSVCDGDEEGDEEDEDSEPASGTVAATVLEAISKSLAPIEQCNDPQNIALLDEQDAYLDELDDRITVLEKLVAKNPRNKEAQAELQRLQNEADELTEREDARLLALELSWLQALSAVHAYLPQAPLHLVRQLRKQVIVHALQWPDSTAPVRALALRALGVFVVRDVAGASSNVPIFLHALENDEERVQEAAQSALADVLLMHGGDEELFDTLRARMNHDDVILRRMAVEACARLLWLNRFPTGSDRRVLGTLMLLHISPSTYREDAVLHDLLARFLPAFAFRHGRNQRLLASVVPQVIRVVAQSQSGNPLAQVPLSNLLAELYALTNPSRLRAVLGEMPQLLAVADVNDALHVEILPQLLQLVLSLNAGKNVKALVRSFSLLHLPTIPGAHATVIGDVLEHCSFLNADAKANEALLTLKNKLDHSESQEAETGDSEAGKEREQEEERQRAREVEELTKTAQKVRQMRNRREVDDEVRPAPTARLDFANVALDEDDEEEGEDENEDDDEEEAAESEKSASKESREESESEVVAESEVLPESEAVEGTQETDTSAARKRRTREHTETKERPEKRARSTKKREIDGSLSVPAKRARTATQPDGENAPPARSLRNRGRRNAE